MLLALRTLFTRPSVLFTVGALSLARTSVILGANLSTTSRRDIDMASRSVQKSEDEWRAVLNKEQFRILRKAGTEMAGTGEYDTFHPADGVFACAGCGTPLYTAKHKFKSGCGWPAFHSAIPGAIERHTDSSWGMERTEIVCKACGGHLGHVFKGEGYDTPTDERHCVNSISLSFQKDAADAAPK